MKLFKKYNERSQKIERFILKNKIFCITVLVLAVLLAGGKIQNKLAEERKSDTTVSEETNENSEDKKVATSGNLEDADNKNEDNETHWRFYWIDLVVLVVGGGFCTFKILQEKRKTKEKLQ